VSDDMQCPACASTDVDRTLLEARAAQYRCRNCDESWVSVSRKA
jgi:transposase-like protein